MKFIFLARYMSRSVFPPKQQAPLFAIRSCIADRANTVNRVEFENLKVVVNDASKRCDETYKLAQQVDAECDAIREKTDQVSEKCDTIKEKTEEVSSKCDDVAKQADEVQQKCDTMEKTIDQAIAKTNEILKTTNLFTIVLDGMYSFVYPRGSVYFSSRTPQEFMKYQGDHYGVWGLFSGNWGYTSEPVHTLTFTWFDPKEVDKKGENDGQDDPENQLSELEKRPTSTEKTPTTLSEDAPTEAGGPYKHVVEIPIYAYYCQQAEDVGDIGSKPPIIEPIEPPEQPTEP